MSGKIYIKTQEDLEKFKQDNKVDSINFDLQARNILEAGGTVFGELADGYFAIHKKRGYGLSKGKVEFYVCQYGGIPQTWAHRDLEVGVKQFSDLHKEGHNFFWVKGVVPGKN